MLRALVMAAVALSALPTSASAAYAATSSSLVEPQGSVVVDVATVNGSGCPTGTASVLVAADNMSFAVAYRDFLAQVGPEAKPTDIRKNCQLSLRVQAPTGFTYAVMRATYRGVAQLAAGATATQSANYYIQGASPTTVATHAFAGPFNSAWETTDTTTVAALAAGDFAPCGEQRNLNINTELRVNAGTSDQGAASSVISMDSMSGDVQTVYHFAWRQCV